jgi:predicted RNA methylase
MLELWEVERYGRDSFDDPDYVSIYGLRPREWYARGVRVLARTAVECTRDPLAKLVAHDVASLVAATRSSGVVTVDPFAGSANTLYWIAREVNATTSIGYELDDAVFELTRQNLAIVGLEVELSHEPFETALPRTSVDEDELVVVFVAPPWGNALDPVDGLDVSRTAPPVVEVVELARESFHRNKIIVAVQLYETVVANSLDAVASFCDWTARKTYDIDLAGRNHGLLLGTIRWSPDP